MDRKQEKNMDHSAVAKFLSWMADEAKTTTEITEAFGWSATDIVFLAHQLREERCFLEQQDGDTWSVTDPKGMGEFTLFWRCRLPVLYIPSCDSTNSVATQMVNQSMPVQLVVADFQTKGRGRLGRVWNSNNAENLLFSLILKPDVPISQMARCTLLWGAEIADELNLHVKWPNDIVDAQGRKVGGILTELLNVGMPNQRVIFGFGLNVNQTAFSAALPNAVSLRMLRDNIVQDRAEICGRLVNRILQTNVRRDLNLWRDRTLMIGQRVQAGKVVGIAQEIREDGTLIVDGQAVLAGDVNLVSEVK